jgi:hypothetical protein
VILLLALSAAVLGATGSDDITAVASRVSKGYVRTVLPDGTYRAETYGFAIGGTLSRVQAALETSAAPLTADNTVDGMGFAEIERDIVGPLRSQSYVPTADPESANLLIVVYWGRTAGTNAFAGTTGAMVNGGDRDAINLQNARLLGFDTEHVFDQGYDDPANMMSNIKKQVHAASIDAIEDDRYYVILRAYDFQALWKHRQPRLQWETRFSLSERHHDFQRDLPGMTQIAQAYFGQDSHGLITKPIPHGQVDVGPVSSLGEVQPR